MTTLSRGKKQKKWYEMLLRSEITHDALERPFSEQQAHHHRACSASVHLAT